MARISVSWLMGLVAIIALGLAAMRVGSLAACAAAMGIMLLALCVATLGAVVRPASAGAWRGFALFGWVYVGATFLRPDLGWGEGAPLPFGIPIERAAQRMHPRPTPPPKPTDPMVLGIRFDRDGQIAQSSRVASPTKAEIDEARRFEQALSDHTDAVLDRGRAIENATRIGHASMAVAIGLIGAVAGRFLIPRDGR